MSTCIEEYVAAELYVCIQKGYGKVNKLPLIDGILGPRIFFMIIPLAFVYYYYNMVEGIYQ